MKKRLFVLFALIFLLGIISNVYAEGESAPVVSGDTLLDSSYNKKMEFLDKPVVLPDSLQIITKVLFGLGNSEEVSLSIFVILIVLLAIMFAVIHMVVSLIPVFDNKAIQYAIAAIITLIVGISGAMREMSIFLFELSTSIKALSNYSIFGIVLSIVVLVVVFFVLQKIINYAKSQYQIEEAKQSARDLIKTIVDSKKV